MKRRQPAKIPTTRATIVWSRKRTIILIDGTVIRMVAVRAYRKAEKALEKVRADMDTFHTKDIAAFTRWEAAQFGQILTHIREMGDELHRKESILEMVDQETFFTRCSRRKAYERVMNRLNNPEPPTPEERPAGRHQEDFFDEDAGEMDDPGAQMFGNSDLPPNFDVDAFDRMSKSKQAAFRRKYEAMAEMYSFMTGFEAPELDQLLEIERQKRRFGIGSPSAGTSTPPPEDPAHRFKSLYRKLVRLLHPDGNANHGPMELALWHDVQIAYQSGDLSRLEAVAARYELSIADHADSLPVGLIQDARRELESALRAVRREARAIKSHPAWKFSTQSERNLQKLHRNRRNELNEQRRELEFRLKLVTKEIDSLAAAPKSRPRRTSGRAKNN